MGGGGGSVREVGGRSENVVWPLTSALAFY